MQGVEYEERMAQLENVEHVKPEAEFIYATYNEFAKHHPWVLSHSIAPKSIARDMFELCASFREYIKEYSLARSEGVLLRYLTDVLRLLERTVPEQMKTEPLRDLQAWLDAELRAVDASLLQEWEALVNPEQAARSQAQSNEARDIFKNERVFRVMVRNAIWRVVQLLSRHDYVHAASAIVDLGSVEHGVASPLATPAYLEKQLSSFFEEFEHMLIDADARSASRLLIEPWTSATPMIRQVLTDPEQELGWTLTFRLHVDASRTLGRPVLSLAAIGET